MRVLVIYSGGMDSFTLVNKYLHEGHEVRALSFLYGQKHKREIEAASRFCKEQGISHRLLLVDFGVISKASSLTNTDIDVPHGHYAADNMKSTVVNGRNTIMLAYALGVAQTIQADAVAYGAHAGDHFIYPDCRPHYIAAMKEVFLQASEGNVRLFAPFQDMTKGQILRYGLIDLGLSVEEYAFTYSCYEGAEKPCGKCGACVERSEAFVLCGVKDPLVSE